MRVQGIPALLTPMPAVINLQEPGQLFGGTAGSPPPDPAQTWLAG